MELLVVHSSRVSSRLGWLKLRSSQRPVQVSSQPLERKGRAGVATNRRLGFSDRSQRLRKSL
jgi:hypothetical protein